AQGVERAPLRASEEARTARRPGTVSGPFAEFQLISAPPKRFRTLTSHPVTDKQRSTQTVRTPIAVRVSARTWMQPAPLWAALASHRREFLQWGAICAAATVAVLLNLPSLSLALQTEDVGMRDASQQAAHWWTVWNLWG